MDNELKIPNSVSLSTSEEELEEKLLTEDNLDELNKVIEIFNINLKRKDLARANKLNELQNQITSQMETRLSKHAGEFSNKDLLDYFKVVQETLNKKDTNDSTNKTAIQINQPQINVNTEGPELSRESREKIKNLIASVMQNQIPISDAKEIIDIEPEEVK